MSKNWSVQKSVWNNELQFTVQWSPWGRMDKWVVTRIIPSESGLFQLWVKSGKGIVLLTTDIAYYGGLRNCLREALDSAAPAGARYRKLMAGRETWFRFSVLTEKDNLVLLKQYFVNSTELFDSEGREVYVNEVDSDRKFALPPPDIQRFDLKHMKDADFGPPIPKVEG